MPADFHTTDQAYANGAYVIAMDALLDGWARDAAAFRDTARGELDVSYGDAPRAIYDLFLPEGPPKGLLVFVHGGYWMQTAPADWSHFSAGALGHGYGVAMLGYPLAPAARIHEIADHVRAALLAVAARIEGPLILAGHSAGGQLVARMASADILPPEIRARLARVVAISPVADLRPLVGLQMNETLRLTPQEALDQSPCLALKEPGVDVRVVVGSEERAAFLDQARWLAQAWDCPQHILPGRNHFDVLEGLRDSDKIPTGLLQVIFGD